MTEHTTVIQVFLPVPICQFFFFPFFCLVRYLDKASMQNIFMYYFFSFEDNHVIFRSTHFILEKLYRCYSFDAN